MGSHAVIRVDSLEEAAASIDIPFEADLQLDFQGKIYTFGPL